MAKRFSFHKDLYSFHSVLLVIIISIRLKSGDIMTTTITCKGQLSTSSNSVDTAEFVALFPAVVNGLLLKIAYLEQQLVIANNSTSIPMKSSILTDEERKLLSELF